MTGSYDKTARIVNVNTGKVLSTFEGHTDSVESVGFCNAYVDSPLFLFFCCPHYQPISSVVFICFLLLCSVSLFLTIPPSSPLLLTDSLLPLSYDQTSFGCHGVDGWEGKAVGSENGSIATDMRGSYRWGGEDQMASHRCPALLLFGGSHRTALGCTHSLMRAHMARTSKYRSRFRPF